MKYFEKEMDTISPEGCVAMTWEDAEEMEMLNQEHGWGFSAPDLLRLISDHLDAFYAEQDGEDPFELYRTQEKIEWRLEDANFHTLRGFLKLHDYKEAITWVTTDIL